MSSLSNYWSIFLFLFLYHTVLITVAWLWNWGSISSNFVLFQYCICYSVSLEFRISFSISTKKSAGMLIGILFNLESSLRNIAILSFPVHEHEMFFHLFRSSLTMFCSFQCRSLISFLLNLFLNILFFDDIVNGMFS